jgi:glycogen debranching enzyme
VPPKRAKKVVQRLMAPDMWTGWGIRTLSANNPAFNPYNYQTGSVWPHDNAIIAMGFKLYGFGAEAARTTCATIWSAAIRRDTNTDGGATRAHAV